MNEDMDSVVVTGESRKDAVENGALELGLHPEDVSSDVIEEGTKGILGFFSKPWKLKVFPREAKDEGIRDATLEEAMKAAESVDGSFQLEVESRKIMLTVFPPSGTGEAVDPSEVVSHLKQIGLSYCDFDLVREVVKKRKGSPEKIGELPPGEDIDTQYEIDISDDALHAELTIRPPKFGGDPPDMEELRRQLKHAEVVEGINWDVVENMVESKRYNETVEVARGREPESGDDARIKYHFKTQSDPQFDSEASQVNFRELGLIENVDEGDLLAEKIEPSPGRPGLTVRGDKIEAPSGEEVTMEYGDNVRKEGNRLFSEIPGQVVLDDGVVQVHEVHNIEGDVDYSTGNVEFRGTVHVDGGVRDRFKVKADGDIIVEGSVGKSYLQAEGDIIVKGGIRGKGRAQLNAQGNIVTEFVEHAGMISQNHIVVSEMILHSQLDAGESIFVSGGRGLLTGGTVRAGLEIYAEEIGSIGTSETRIEVGIDPVFFREMSKIELKILEQQEKLDKIERAIQTLEGREDLNEDQEEKLRSLRENEESLNRNIDNFREEQETLVRRAEEREGARISCSGTVFTGTKIVIGNDIYTIRASEKEHCTFKKLGSSIDAGPFEEISPPEV
ncbi:MAG: FapA family protein [bacterium]